MGYVGYITTDADRDDVEYWLMEREAGRAYNRRFMSAEQFAWAEQRIQRPVRGELPMDYYASIHRKGIHCWLRHGGPPIYIPYPPRLRTYM